MKGQVPGKEYDERLSNMSFRVHGQYSFCEVNILSSLLGPLNHVDFGDMSVEQI